MPPWLITGSSRGIGLALCRELRARGDAVIAVCRHASPELEALAVRIEAGIDLTEATAAARLAERLGELPLAGAILNSGMLEADRLETLPADGLRRQFKINALHRCC